MADGFGSLLSLPGNLGELAVGEGRPWIAAQDCLEVRRRFIGPICAHQRQAELGLDRRVRGLQNGRLILGDSFSKPPTSKVKVAETDARIDVGRVDIENRAKLSRRIVGIPS